MFCLLNDKEYLEKFLLFVIVFGFCMEVIYVVRLVEFNFCSFKEKFGINFDGNDRKFLKIEFIFFNLIVVNMVILCYFKLDLFLMKFLFFVMMIWGYFKKMFLKILIFYISVKVYCGVIKIVYGCYYFE